jgi:hypothetical protein
MKPKPSAEPQASPFELALRIRHPSIDPSDLTRGLGIEPTHSFRAGESRYSHGNSVPHSVYGESYWLGALDSTSPSSAWLSGFADVQAAKEKLAESVSRSLELTLAKITRTWVRTHAALFERIRTESGQVSLLVSLSPKAVDSFSLTPEVTRIFGELGITVEFEMTG